MLAEMNHAKIIEYLNENGCKWDNKTKWDVVDENDFDALDLASRNGNLERLKFLHKNRDEGCSFDALIYAAENGHIDIIKWLHENQIDNLTKRSYKLAIQAVISNNNFEYYFSTNYTLLFFARLYSSNNK